MNKTLLAPAMMALIGICGVATADDRKDENPNQSTFEPRKTVSAPIERLVRDGRSCYKETIIEKMVEACLEGKTYYTPITEKSRVKVKCPSK